MFRHKKLQHTKKTKIIFQKPLLIIGGIILLVFISELTFILNNHPESIKKFRSQLTLESLQRLYLTKITSRPPVNKIENYLYYKISPGILYSYLSEMETNSYPTYCKPICRNYNDSKEIFDLYGKLDSQKSFDKLPELQKSNLYFWMATISIWVNDDQEKTLSLLEKSVSQNPDNAEANIFWEDLKKIKSLEKNSEYIKYFEEKLSRIGELENYKKIYYSQAVFSLGQIYKSQSDFAKASQYLSGAIDLYAWNELYYLALADTFIAQEKQTEAYSVLRKCTELLSKNARTCQSRKNEIDIYAKDKT